VGAERLPAGRANRGGPAKRPPHLQRRGRAGKQRYGVGHTHSLRGPADRGALAGEQPGGGPHGSGGPAAAGGWAKVLPGVTFTAKTLLDVATHSADEPLDASMLAESPPQNASESEKGHFFRHLPLQRGRFPQPEAVPGLPYSDITMQVSPHPS